MLTPKQIMDYDFQVAGKNAYRSQDVDAFVDEVYASYDQMFRENGELVKKLNLVADKLQEYKQDEDNIRNALLTAERMKDSIISEAKASVKKIIDDGNEQADAIIAEAEEKSDEILKTAQTNAAKLLQKAQNLYDEQVKNIQEESERETAHLESIRAEAAKVCADLIETYRKQISILEFTAGVAEKPKERKIEENYVDTLSRELDLELESITSAKPKTRSRRKAEDAQPAEKEAPSVADALKEEPGLKKGANGDVTLF